MIQSAALVSSDDDDISEGQEASADSRHQFDFSIPREAESYGGGEADSSGTFPFSDADCELLHHPRPSFSLFRPLFHAHSSGTPRHVQWLGLDLRRNMMLKVHHTVQAHPSPSIIVFEAL